MDIDSRHVDVLEGIALALPRNSLIVEVGAGASTIAFLRAMIERPHLSLVSFDVNPPCSVGLAIAASQCSDRVTTVRRAVGAGMPSRPTLVFIDADHSWPGVADFAAALTAGARIIAAHDTYLYGPCTEGSRLIGELLRTAEGRQWWEDHTERPGEATDRGLTVSWPDGPEWRFVPAAIREVETCWE